MTDIQRAMLGDHAVAARLTEQGVLLPCPWCKKTVAHVGTYAEHECMDEDDPGYGWSSTHYDVVCDFTAGGCGASTGPRESAEEALADWNTRAPILSAEKIERLEAQP